MGKIQIGSIYLCRNMDESKSSRLQRIYWISWSFQIASIESDLHHIRFL